GIHDLYIAADRGPVNDPQFEIAEFQRRALQTRGRGRCRIDYRILAVAVLEHGQAHGDRVARVEVAGKGVKGQESSKGNYFVTIRVDDKLSTIVERIVEHESGFLARGDRVARQGHGHRDGERITVIE